MSGKQQGLRYFQKFLNSKASERNALAKKVLRYVMAVGFVLSPWLGGEAYAAGIVRADGTPETFVDNKNAHIYAQKVDASGKVGLNQFQEFNVNSGQTANLYFKTAADQPAFDTLVNTVQGKINISGTVNAIKNNANGINSVGGNLYFISPKGMVVGSSGVINAGALTMIVSDVNFSSADAAATAVTNNSWGNIVQLTSDNQPVGIDIQGQINTATGIDLRAAYINMTKSTDTPNPYLKTGMLFNTTVKADGLVDTVTLQGNRLTAAEVNGEIKLYAKYDSNNSTNSGKIALSDGVVDAVGNVNIEAGKTVAIVNGDIDASGKVDIIANKNRINGDDVGEVTLSSNSNVYAGGNIYIAGDKSINLQSTIIRAGGTIDFYSKWYDGDECGGALTVNGGSISAPGAIYADVGKKITLENGGSITSTNGLLTLYCKADGGKDYYNSSVELDSGTISGYQVKFDIDDDLTINEDASVSSTYDLNVNTEQGDIINKGTISGTGQINLISKNGGNRSTKDNKKYGNIINEGTICVTGNNVSLTASNNLTNTRTIQADGQIKFAVGGNLTNNGTIQSTSSNVQAHIGRNFNNIPVPASANSSTLTGGIIQAGGNVQVDYNLDNEGIGVASSEEAIDGISNSGRIWAKGAEDPVYDEAGNITSSGSGNIWLTSSYNITNYGTIKANRQITLNARDFLHNHGLIEGVTYLDIKSIMGYVYNHKDGVIRSTGGNIDLSSGQANLEIKNDTDGTKKELYRKFTPIIIEGLVEATSDLNNTTNETNQGNINIRAYLGDIYINGGTIEAKAGTSGEVESVAGNVTLDAAQNITIGFQTKSASADDPTTQAGPNGENKDKYERDDEREYYKPKVDDTSGNLVSGNAAQISSTNITLTSGSRATNTISISAVNNALTASDSIELNSGGNVTVGAGASVTLGGSLQLQGNNIYVAGVQRSGNPTEPLKVEANGAGGTDSAINSLNLNIAGDVLFNTLNVNTAEVNVSGDLQIKQLHVADQAHFTSNNTMIGVYGEATEPRGDQSDALYRDMGDGSDSWMSISMDSKGYEIKNGSEIKSVLGDGTEDPVQMSSKLVDVDPQETLVENYGDATGNFGRFDLVDDSARPSGGIESTDQGSQTVLKQDENGLHIETSDNKVDNGSQIEAGDNKVDNGSQIEAGDNKVDNGSQIEAGDNKVDNGTQIEAGDDKGDQGSQIEAGDDKGDQGSQIEAGDDKEDEDSQLEAGDKKKNKSKRDKKDKREKQKKDK